jgi:hypothetical protein
VTGINSYEVLVYKSTDYTTAWDVENISSSTTSVIFGTAPAGSNVTVGPVALSTGTYNVIIHAKDASDNLVGRANGIITVN